MIFIRSFFFVFIIMVINLTGTSPDGDAFDLVKTTVSPIVTSPGNTLERCLEYFSPEFYIYYKFYNIN